MPHYSWLLLECDYAVGSLTCHQVYRRPITHIIFLNGILDATYAVGCCSQHRRLNDETFVTIAKFRKTLKRLEKLGVEQSDMPMAVSILLDPIPVEFSEPGECPQCSGTPSIPFISGNFICPHPLHCDTAKVAA